MFLIHNITSVNIANGLLRKYFKIAAQWPTPGEGTNGGVWTGDTWTLVRETITPIT